MNRSGFFIATAGVLAGCAAPVTSGRSLVPSLRVGGKLPAAVEKTITGWNFLSADGSVVGTANTVDKLSLSFITGRNYRGLALDSRRVASANNYEAPKFLAVGVPGITLSVPLDVDSPSLTLSVGSRSVSHLIAARSTAQLKRHIRSGACDDTSEGLPLKPVRLASNNLSNDPQTIYPALMAAAAFDNFVQDAQALKPPDNLIDVKGVLTGTVDENGIPVIDTTWTWLVDLPGIGQWFSQLSAASISVLMEDLTNMLFWLYMAGCFG